MISRHIQRTRVLIHLLDGMAEDPVLDYAQINSELALFDENLTKKPQVVALNKMDMPEVKERWPKILAGLKRRGLKGETEPMLVSAITGENVELPTASQRLQRPTWKIEAVPVYCMAEIKAVHHQQEEDGYAAWQGD
jgi:GTP-binding protein